MLTRLRIRRFKLFEEADIELGERVVFVGPNNSGKTSALQAIALWSAGVRRWTEKRGSGKVPRKRSGVTLNRRDLVALPVPAANLLWHDLRVREGVREGGRRRTRNVLVEIDVDGVTDGSAWSTSLEFDYANEESFYCRSRLGPDGERLPVPEAAAQLRVVYLPPMSGLAAQETRLDDGAIQVRIGEGRTAEVLRNLCWKVFERDPEGWAAIVQRIESLFGAVLDAPRYVPERGEIVMSYRTPDGVRLDLAASGRGQQQTLLLFAYMGANPGSVLLLDEPDAHLEILRQRQIYEVLTETASETGSQIIAASHSEVILNEAAGRDVVVAFVGRPHRIDRGSQVLKALRDIGFEDYLQAEQTGWALYLEGSTDLAILREFAAKLGHPAQEALARPFVRYVGNQPMRAREHFHGLREAHPRLVGIAIYDRLDLPGGAHPDLVERTWRKREIENYLCQRETLLAWAAARGREAAGPLFASTWERVMREVVEEVERSLATIGKPSPWGDDLKVSDEFLPAVFRLFFERLGLPNPMAKTRFHVLARFVPDDAIDPEVRAMLDAVARVAKTAVGRR